MKNRRTLKMILALGGMVTSLAFASKGGSVSSGGEHITYERNPWFIGSEPVHYCIEIAEENFSLSLGEANLAIQSAIADWTKTLRTLKPRPTGTNYVHNEPKNLTLQFEYDSVCNSKSELRFLFGVMNASIQSDLKGHAAHTIAYSKMSSFNDSTGRAKGYLWVVPDRGANAYQGPRYLQQNSWSDTNRLRALLIHEMGHVFGFGHTDYGVMNSQVPSYIMQRTSYAYTSQNYANFNWLEEGTEVCGTAVSDASEIEKWLGIPLNISDQEKICVTPSGKQPNELKVTLYLSQVKKKTFTIKKINTLFATSGFILEANYLWSHKGVPTTYSSHRFLTLWPENFVGHYEMNGKKILVTVSSIFGFGIRFNAIMNDGSDAQWYDLRFPAGLPWI